MEWTRTFSFILLSSLLSSITAQTLKFDYLTMDDGLSQSTINCILQDSQGYIWIGTEDGLNRYNGHDFEVYRHQTKDPFSITHNWILSIYEDGHQNLWVGTWKGLNKYDREMNRFISYDSLPNFNEFRFTSFTEDSENNLWIGSWGGGLHRYIRKNDSFQTFQHEPKNSLSISSDQIQAIHFDRANNLWVGTWSGLNQFHQETETFERFNITNSNLKGNEISTVQEGQNGRIWIGTYYDGLHYMDPFSNQIIPFSGVCEGTIYQIFKARSGKLWLASSCGLYKKTLTSPLQSFQLLNEDGLLSNKAFSIAEDKSGNIWIGGVGINIYKPSKNQFNHYQSSQSVKNSLNHDVIWDFAESNNKVWIATSGGGINVFGPKEKSFEQIPTINDRVNDVYQIEIDRIGRVWIGSADKGLFVFNTKTQTLKNFSEDAGNGNTNGLNSIYSLKLQEPYLWIGTREEGLIQFHVENETFKRFTSDSQDRTTISSNLIQYLFIDSNDNLWVGSRGQGLSLKPRGNDQFVRFNVGNNRNEISSNLILSIFEDSNNNIWIGTSEGLNKLVGDPLSDNYYFEKITRENGLPNNTIYGILEDGHGNLWVSTNHGISKFNLGENSFENYYQKDGLQHNEFNTGSLLKTRDGHFLFGGINGFNFFHPDSIRMTKSPPPIVLTSFKVFGKEFPLEKAIDQLKRIDLNHSQNFFSFEYAGLDYTNPEQTEYLYKMEGFDEDWVNAGTRRYASYTNLDPGDYRFKVKTIEDVPHGEYATIQLRITPPFWMTWWFRASVGIVALVLAFFTYQKRVGKLKRQRDQKQQLINTISETQEKERIRIARDLHDSVGSMLSSIKYQLAGLVTDPSLDKPMELLDQTHDEVRRISHNMLPGALLKLGLAAGIQSLAESPFNKNGMVVKTHIYGLDKRLDPQIETSVFRMIQELLQNALKHADAKHVDINVTRHHDYLDIMVSDDGGGFDMNLSNVTNGIGLNNIENRIREINGSFHLDTSPGNGTSINLTIPINKPIS